MNILLGIVIVLFILVSLLLILIILIQKGRGGGLSKIDHRRHSPNIPDAKPRRASLPR